MKAEYEQRNALLTSDFNLYNSSISTLNSNVEYWNRHGGVPDYIYRKLAQEKDELDSHPGKLKGEQDDLRRLAETINSMVVVINEIAANINLDSVNYNNTGDALGREFCVGFYESKKANKQ